MAQPYDPSSPTFLMLGLVRWPTLHNHHDGVIAKIWIMCFMLSVRVSSLWLLGSSSPGVYQLGLKRTKTPPSCGKVESGWSHTSVPPWCVQGQLYLASGFLTLQKGSVVIPKVHLYDIFVWFVSSTKCLNPLIAKLNPICHLLAL